PEPPLARPAAGRPRLAHRLPGGGAHRRARRRRPLHRPHGARRRRGAVRLRPAASRAARGPLRPRAQGASGQAGLRGQEPADRQERARERARGGARRGRRGHDQPPGGGGAGMRKDLVSIDDLSREDIERILERAESFAEVSGREIKKVPALRGRTIVNLFYAASTRTSSSFELAAKRLSADVVNIRSAGSSVDKGESLKDTSQTLSAYDPAAIVIRSPHAGAAQLVAGWTDASVINAGDGKHEHPTQALLDVFTLRRAIGSLDRKRIWIVGDVMHSRVARSDILAFTRMGAEVTVCGPPTLIPRKIEALGCRTAATLERLHDADVVYVLRMQNERMRESFVPSLREYAG